MRDIKLYRAILGLTAALERGLRGPGREGRSTGGRARGGGVGAVSLSGVRNGREGVRQQAPAVAGPPVYAPGPSSLASGSSGTKDRATAMTLTPRLGVLALAVVTFTLLASCDSGFIRAERDSNRALRGPQLSPDARVVLVSRQVVAAFRHDPPGWGVRSIAFSLDGTTLLSLQTSGVSVVDLASRQPRPPFPQTDLALQCMAISPDGRTVATGGFLPHPNGDVRLWEVASGTLRRVLSGQPARVTALAFEADGRGLVGWNGRSVQRWDVTSGQLLETRPLRGVIVVPRRSM
jgi:WD40 repeat protein